MRVKTFCSSVFILWALILFTSCRNSTAANENKLAKPQCNSVDTSSCQFIIKRDVIGHDTIFYTASSVVRDTIQTIISCDIKKYTKGTKDLIPLHIYFKIDSPICIHQLSRVTFFFSDGTSFFLINHESDNCAGEVRLYFNHDRNGISTEQEHYNIEKVKSKKIQALRFDVVGGYRQYGLKDFDACLLRDYICCLRKANW